ncbi:uncharacterized protein C16orf46 homolog isoform X1 [Arvicola amphibius]|uniref:uncharacterized protein C16orf46 homolog isoform X1 n=1 Tax=Arvicola amphibius TaxID=1047088 RepID=UPI0018E2FBE9|nr:uncharacterized protein C16orf46 homolog isoform X1 [Arvicola amphibius]
MSLSQGSLEACSLSEVGKLEAGAVAEVSPEKNWSSPSQDPSTDSREPNKLCFPTYLHGEKKSLQIKEFIWCMEEWAIPETVSSKTCRTPCGSTDRSLSASDSLASKDLVVLPPLKSCPPNSLDVLSKKDRSIFWQPEEKAQRGEKDECVACSDRLKTVDGKGEKRHLELASRLKVTDQLPFPPPMVRTHLLAAESQRCCLRWSLLPQKSSTYPSNPDNIRYLATLQVLQKQGMPSYRSRLKAKESKPSRNTSRHTLGEAKQESSDLGAASVGRRICCACMRIRVQISSTHTGVRLCVAMMPVLSEGEGSIDRKISGSRGPARLSYTVEKQRRPRLAVEGEDQHPRGPLTFTHVDPLHTHRQKCLNILQALVETQDSALPLSYTPSPLKSLRIRRRANLNKGSTCPKVCGGHRRSSHC